MQDRIFCEYCEKVLSQQKGEYDNGCLDCHGQPYANKIFWLKKENKKLQAENAKLRECVQLAKSEFTKQGYYKQANKLNNMLKNSEEN